MAKLDTTRSNSAINKICFNRLTIGNLPSSYWESLTYEEQVLWLQKRLNDDIIPAINEMTSFIENYDSQVEEIQYQIDVINSYIAGFDRKIEQANQQTIDLLENELTIVENELRDMILSNYNVLKDYVDERDAYLEDKINNISIDTIILRDPTTGLMSNIQVVVNNIYNANNVNGLTADEFDDLELTCSEFEAYEITAFDFDNKGKLILIG